NPNPNDVQVIQDKLKQKDRLSSVGLPMADYMEIGWDDEMFEAAKAFGYPFLLKSRRGGFDGRGNLVVREDTDLFEAFSSLNLPLYAERFVPFEKELA